MFIKARITPLEAFVSVHFEKLPNSTENDIFTRNAALVEKFSKPHLSDD